VGAERERRMKKQKRVGRFFWENLEAKPFNFELAKGLFIKITIQGQGFEFA
jgi:hypothetical protein